MPWYTMRERNAHRGMDPQWSGERREVVMVRGTTAGGLEPNGIAGAMSFASQLIPILQPCSSFTHLALSLTTCERVQIWHVWMACV